MKRSFFAPCVVFALSLWPLVASGQDDALLDRVISRPGSYYQVCDMVTAPEDIPFRAFLLSSPDGAAFSQSNLTAIANHREGLVKSIRARLLAVDFSKKPKEIPQDPKPENEDPENDETGSGCDPASLNPLLLELIQELHAIETLPELLAVEEKLVKGIAAAKDDAKAPPPMVDGWFVASEARSKKEESNDKPLTDAEIDALSRPDDKRDRPIYLFQARVAQRDLVLLMAMLMREKSYEPYLKTSIEAAYAKGLKAQSKAGELTKIKPGEPVPDEVEIDPVTRFLREKYSPVKIPYTREARDEVRAAAGKWIAAHP